MKQLQYSEIRIHVRSNGIMLPHTRTAKQPPILSPCWDFLCLEEFGTVDQF